MFAKKGDTIIFGLPGNPSSVLTCFYEYVLPALELLMNRKAPFLKTSRVALVSDYTKNTSLTHFLKGWFQDGKVTPLDAQESYKMKSFATANCLIVLNEEDTFLTAGQIVEVHHLF